MFCFQFAMAFKQSLLSAEFSLHFRISLHVLRELEKLYNLQMKIANESEKFILDKSFRIT